MTITKYISFIKSLFYKLTKDKVKINVFFHTKKKLLRAKLSLSISFDFFETLKIEKKKKLHSYVTTRNIWEMLNQPRDTGTQSFIEMLFLLAETFEYLLLKQKN